jgi:hypothetical protein
LQREPVIRGAASDTAFNDRQIPSAREVARVMAEAQEIMMGEMPPELAELRTQFAAEQPDPVSQILMTDADIVQKRSGADGDLR